MPYPVRNNIFTEQVSNGVDKKLILIYNIRKSCFFSYFRVLFYYIYIFYPQMAHYNPPRKGG